MKNFLYLIIFISLTGNAQSLQEFRYLGDIYQKNKYLGAMGNMVFVRNPAAPKPEIHSKNGILLELNHTRIDFSKGGRSYRLDYKLFTDIFFLFDRMVDRKQGLNRDESSGISSGIIGWHAYGWNVIATPKFCLAPGFTLNDYFTGTSYSTSSGGLISNEPQGWYLAAGPSLMTHHYLNKAFVMHTQFSMAASYARPVSLTYAVVDEHYNKPWFAHATATIVSKWGVFVEAQYAKLLNRGNLPNATTRLDLKLGFQFVL